MKHKTRSLWPSIFLTGALFCFYLFYIISAANYPGGTWSDPSTVGYSFWHNFLCDVTLDHALNGSKNPGQPFAIVSFVFIGLALWSLWNILSLMTKKYFPKLSRMGLVFAALSCIGFYVSMIFGPTESRFSVHSIAVLAALFFGAPAMIMPMILFLTIRELKSFGKLCLLLCAPAAMAAISYVLYQSEVFTNDSIMTSAQKVATMAVSVLALVSAKKYARVSFSLREGASFRESFCQDKNDD